jgi:protein-tyrosine phosphatase
MTQITPKLFLGDANDAQNYDFLRDKKISIIVNAAKEIPNYFERNLEHDTKTPGSLNIAYIRLNLDDTQTQNLSGVLPVVDTIISAIKNGQKVFIHCAAGVSRSSSIVIYTIMKLHGWPFEKSYLFVKALHPRTEPNNNFKRQLMELEGRPRSIEKSVGDSRMHPLILPTDTLVPSERMRPEDTSVVGSYPIRTSHSIVEPENTSVATSTGTRLESGLYGDSNKLWKLTLDCAECDKPRYVPQGRGRYAAIF